MTEQTRKPRPTGLKYQTQNGEAVTIGDWTWRPELLEAKIVKGPADWCWEWQGAKGTSANQFGATKHGHKQMTQAVRLYYQQLTGEDCSLLQIRHTCGDKFCMNPAHWTTRPNHKLFNSDGTVKKTGDVKPATKPKEPKIVKTAEPKAAKKQSNRWWTE